MLQLRGRALKRMLKVHCRVTQGAHALDSSMGCEAARPRGMAQNNFKNHGTYINLGRQTNEVEFAFG